MKRNILAQVAEHFKKFKKISALERVDDSIVKIVFDAKEMFYFDMKRGDPYIFKKDGYRRSKEYIAPFDIILKKRFANSKIENVEVAPGNRILKFEVVSSSKYKALKSLLQFEFTGRNTNVIILDENKTVMEAFRHIDRSVSFREVKVGSPLLPLPEKIFEESFCEITDIDDFLANEYKNREKKRLFQLKNQKIVNISKKVDKLNKILLTLSGPDELLKKSKKNQEWGNLILSNIYKIKNYQKSVCLSDHEGRDIQIDLPKESRTPAEAANIFFSRSKKPKQKALNLHIKKEGLEEKLSFLHHLEEIVKKAKSCDEVNLYMPKQKKQNKKEARIVGVENFFYEGYKVILGKSEKGNINLLKSSKKSDIWLHLKNMPSCHVVIKSGKVKMPQPVLEFAAKLCVDFSVSQAGSYLVDYTKRGNVKIVNGANVNYTDYKTLSILKG